MPSMRLDDARERFLVQARADGRSPHTVALHAGHLRAFALWVRRAGLCGDVATFGHEDLARFLTAPEALRRRDGGAKKAASVNALRGSLRAFFGYCVRAGWVEVDASRMLQNARCSPPPPRSMTEAQVAALETALAAAQTPAEKRDRVLFALLIDVGVRLGSAIGLDVSDLDLESGQATVKAKGGRTDEVYLPTAVQALLAEYVAGRSGPVFITATGGRIGPRHAQRRFALWVRRAGIKGRFSPHSLRHSFALRLYRQTGDLLVVKEALGHRSASSTLVYARADAERVRRAVHAARLSRDSSSPI